jgi:hypothetical protein
LRGLDAMLHPPVAAVDPDNGIVFDQTIEDRRRRVLNLSRQRCAMSEADTNGAWISCHAACQRWAVGSRSSDWAMRGIMVAPY